MRYLTIVVFLLFTAACSSSGPIVPDSPQNSCDTCKQPCENCLKGEFLCVNAGMPNQYCAECLFPADCKEGFVCPDHHCVPKNNQQEGALCTFDWECAEGYSCAQNSCVGNAFLSQLEPCPAAGICAQTCEHCSGGQFRCTGYSPHTDKPDEGKCVECISDLSCNEGFRCQAYRCIPT